jgi:hypothetical protein
MDQKPLFTEARALIDEQTAAGQRAPTFGLIETFLVKSWVNWPM